MVGNAVPPKWDLTISLASHRFILHLSFIHNFGPSFISFFDVSSRIPKAQTRIKESSQPTIAVYAEQAPHHASLVIVVNCQALIMLLAPTNSASTILLLKDRRIRFFRNSVLTSKPVIARLLAPVFFSHCRNSNPHRTRHASGVLSQCVYDCRGYDKCSK